MLWDERAGEEAESGDDEHKFSSLTEWTQELQHYLATCDVQQTA